MHTHAPTGSTDSQEAPKTQPATATQKKTTIRRIKGFYSWFEPDPDLKTSLQSFYTGLLRDVTFDPKAPVMKDVFCGRDHVSEATATGILEVMEENPDMPGDATVVREIDYDRVHKVFHTRGKPEETFASADYVVLRENGTSIAGWRAGSVEIP